MAGSPEYHPGGDMPAQLDTKKAHLVRYHGDLAVLFTWINDERAMVLIPHRRPGAPWYVVMDSAAHTWDERDPLNHYLIIQKLVKACEVLGIEPSSANCRRLANIIMVGIPDLVSMPSAPPTEFYKPSFGRMVLNADGKPLAEEDIRVEKEGVTYG